jgi:hypothetical protein
VLATHIIINEQNMQPAENCRTYKNMRKKQSNNTTEKNHKRNFSEREEKIEWDDEREGVRFRLGDDKSLIHMYDVH